MLSDSYVVEVTYKQGEEDFDSESWFVKVKNNINIVKILNLLYHSFMYSPVSLLSGIYPLPAMHSLLVTSDVRIINNGLSKKGNTSTMNCQGKG